jgi:hypothetical protein
MAEVCAARVRHVAVRVVAAMGALLLLGAAGPPLQGGGTGFINIDPDKITEVRNAGGNSFQERELSGTIAGTLNGTFEEHATGTVHRNGRITFRAELVFTGTIEGCGEEQHTLVLNLAGQGVSTDVGPITEAQVRVVGDERNTVRATGQGTVSQQGPFLTYELQYKCR